MSKRPTPTTEAGAATETKCPFPHAAGSGTSNRDWWPSQLNLKVLHQQDFVAAWSKVMSLDRFDLAA
jgi:catalase (peroxidase I)